MTKEKILNWEITGAIIISLLGSLFHFMFASFVSPVFANVPSMFPAPPDLSPLAAVEKLHKRIRSYPEMANWQAAVLTTLRDMDKDWKPKKKTVVEKFVIVKDKVRIEKILSATEYEGDRTKDLTAKYQAEAEKFNKKSESSQGEDGGRKGGRYRGLDLSRDEMFPFGEDRRADYEYELREGTLAAGQRVHILETLSLQKSSDIYEGKYFIHPETYDILRAELRPAKNPGPLKLLEMHIDFDRLPEGYLVIKSTRIRIHVGLIVKNIRMESEERYSDFQVLDDPL